MKIASPNFRTRQRPKDSLSFDEMEERALLLKDYHRFKLVHFNFYVTSKTFDKLDPTCNEQNKPFNIAVY